MRFGPVPSENRDHTTAGDGLDDQRRNSESGELGFKMLFLIQDFIMLLMFQFQFKLRFPYFHLSIDKRFKLQVVQGTTRQVFLAEAFLG